MAATSHDGNLMSISGTKKRLLRRRISDSHPYKITVRYETGGKQILPQDMEYCEQVINGI
jgi:hypothetical protein